jgi:hypothetical protein
MSITDFDLVRSKEYAAFVAAVNTALGSGWQPQAGGKVFKDADGYYNLPMIKGSDPQSFADVSDLLSAVAGTAEANKALILGASGDIDALNSASLQVRGQSVTATVDGTTTGLIPAGASFVTVTSDDANKQISLPAGQVGDVIRIKTDATGCELIAVTAADKVNDVTVGATNECALPGDSHFVAEYVAANRWIVRGVTKLGANIAALVPDIL